MNTTSQKSQSGLQNSTEQLSTGKRGLARINRARRRVNRALDTDKLLLVLRREAPSFFSLAEVVGKWVWIQFAEKQPSRVTRVLAEFGFHWNQTRQSWQHPCGLERDIAATFDPRQRYGSYFAADMKPV